jgi:tetratricopeptide (TPR) repeat protein
MNSNSLKARQDKPKHYRGSTFSPANWEAKNRAPKRQQSAVTDGYLRSSASLKAQERDYTGAIALLSQLINRHPDNAIDYNNRGLVYFQSGEPTLAIIDYDKALQLNPQLASAYNNRANYYAACGRLETAIADYDQAIDLKPSYVRAWLNRGITLRDLGQYEQAIENFDIALLLGQIEGHIYAERGRTYHLWGDWNYAIADYRRALTHLPQTCAKTDPARRLRLKVEKELNQLLTPLET